jgi:hypothetical protein
MQFRKQLVAWMLGAVFCSLPACIDPQSSSVGVENPSDSGEGGEDGNPALCRDGETKVADDGCNGCFCEDGTWACTTVDCTELCTPGETRQNGMCNTCTCDDDHSWVCTRLACTCDPGEVRPAGDNCNQCTCSDEGIWSCTQLPCPPCAPGTSIPAFDGCNTCTCNEGDSNYTCTEDVCSPCPTVTPTGCLLPWGYIRNSDTGQCCHSTDLCNVPDGWEHGGETIEACRVGPCEPMHVSCDGDLSNGCEVNLLTSPEHCGACGRACNFDNATGTCDMGNCSVVCEAGFADCNGDLSDGCETDTRTSVDNCGACGNVCDLQNVTTHACAMGTCIFVECDEGFFSCDSDPTNGCEFRMDQCPFAP